MEQTDSPLVASFLLSCHQLHSRCTSYVTKQSPTSACIESEMHKADRGFTKSTHNTSARICVLIQVTHDASKQTALHLSRRVAVSRLSFSMSWCKPCACLLTTTAPPDLTLVPCLQSAWQHLTNAPKLASSGSPCSNRHMHPPDLEVSIAVIHPQSMTQSSRPVQKLLP